MFVRLLSFDRGAPWLLKHTLVRTVLLPPFTQALKPESLGTRKYALMKCILILYRMDRHAICGKIKWQSQTGCLVCLVFQTAQLFQAGSI